MGRRTFIMADGRELPSYKFNIRELRVGNHVLRDVEASLNPALTDPLLGGSFLSRVASWSIDNQRSTLILSP
jgi:predicted aspartyl protease